MKSTQGRRSFELQRRENTHDFETSLPSTYSDSVKGNHGYVIVAKENSTLATGPTIFILDKYHSLDESEPGFRNG